MTITTTTHLNFPGTARAALDFYQSVFGGEVDATTYGQLGMPETAPDAQKVVFGRLTSPEGFDVMAYDVPGNTPAEAVPASGTRRNQGMTITDQPFFLSIRGNTLAEVAKYWEGLSEGASIIEPLAASEWSPGFGMLTDRFGVTWVLDVQAAPEG
ncbi:VOC family protein [Brevibacterium sp. UCMA 11754]|uniref:VOC family protein n=1 Tax=Brevibacterium sp. UCMA 11754 TaxID=2749198 RepID=UPI001F25858F|nr:VOC family protein [Brevibacterium sp. UCMA 11754]MCF2573614.1 VOC family protein [Brevibacterium sp. UCMA 11754]